MTWDQIVRTSQLLRNSGICCFQEQALCKIFTAALQTTAAVQTAIKKTAAAIELAAAVKTAVLTRRLAPS